MDSSQSEPAINNHPHQLHPQISRKPKNSRKPVVIAAVIICALSLLIALGLLVAYLINDEKSSGTKVGNKLALSASSQGAFMHNGYINGARPMRVEGEVRVLGLSEDGSRLALWREGSSRTPSELVVHDTASLKQVASAPVDECVPWEEAVSVLCAVNRVGSADLLIAYDLKKATPISEQPIFSNPKASELAAASSLRSLEVAGAVDDITILSVSASNSYLNPSDMTAQEATRAKNLMGLYVVDNFMVVAVRENGDVVWTHDMKSSSSCGVVMDGSAIACLSKVAEDDSDQTSVVTLDAATGNPLAEHSTSKEVTMATDGWVESDGYGADKGSAISFDALSKGMSVSTYDFNGHKKEDTTLEAGAVIGDMIPAPEWNSDKKALYPLEQLLRRSDAEVAIDSQGTVIASHQAGSDGSIEIVRSSSGRTITKGTVSCMSRDGRSLLAMSQDYNDISAKPIVSLFDVERGEKVAELTEGNAVLARCDRGVIVVDDMGSLDDVTIRNRATIIYVPGR